jgi:stage V sporulation protein B
MATSTLPAVVRLSAQKRFSERRARIYTVVKINMAIAIPCAVGLAVLAEPIVTVLFPTLVTYRHVAAGLLRYGSVGCVFYALSTVTTSVLQGCGRMRIPVVHSIISFVIHAALVFLLLHFTSLGIWARLIGDVTFPLLIAILNILQIKRRTGFVPDVKRTFVLPTASAAVMGCICLGTYSLLSFITSSLIVSFAVALALAVALYAVLLLLLPVFSDEEYLQLPKGALIARLSAKLRARIPLPTFLK